MFLPSPTGWNSINLCFSTTNCAIPLGGTNTYFFEVLNVNGSPDSNISNNYSQCVVTRNATATNNDVVGTDIKFVEVRQFSNLYEKTLRYSSIEEVILEKGLNIIHIHYSDGTVEIRKISVN